MDSFFSLHNQIPPAKIFAAPLKRLGQNFLISKGVLEKIIQAAGLNKEEVVLEIGPGLSTLTQELARRAKKVIAVEKDRKFVEILKETLKDYKNVQIIEGDILKFDISNWVPPFKKGGVGGILPNKDKSTPALLYKRRGLKYKLVANLPYNIASAVIRKFLEAENKPKEMLLMVQKEVAQRICASPPNMSLLAVSVQFYAQPKIIDYVSKGSFWPPPKVDSAILKITSHPKQSRFPLSERGIKGDLEKNKIHPTPPLQKEGIENFFKVVKAGFSSPRKQLLGNLTKRLKIERNIIEKALKKVKISPAQRAETLSIDDWIRIYKNIGKLGY